MNYPINFEEASIEWRKNKIYVGNGYFRYKCKVANCNEALYCYTTQHKAFLTFATEFDLLNKDNPNQFTYCETHLLNEF